MFNRLLLILPILAIFGVGCDSKVAPYSGTICLTIEHHGVPSFGTTVYRNYGESFPGYHQDMGAFYDTIAETGLRNSVCFQRLGVGGHWFAAEGYDGFIQDSIRGSLFIDLGTRQDQVDTVLKVSEQH